MRIKKIFYSKIFLAVLIVIILAILPNFYKRLNEKKVLENQVNNLDMKIESIERENEEIEKELAALGGSEESEKVLRRLYVLKKPGEEALIIPEEFLIVKEDEENESFWGKIKGIFK